MASRPETLRILCFGDSLTEGFTDRGMRFEPYSAYMKAMLEKQGIGNMKIEVVTEGQSGELATAPGFERRMTAKYLASTTAKPLYDWVLILGGTNDLGWGKPVREIFDALIDVSQIALDNGAKVLMMTVPECTHRSTALDKKRTELNALIKNDTRENLYIFDLQTKIPNHSMDEAEKREIWDDGLHLTSKGYERMGEMIADRLIEIIEAVKPSTDT